MGFRGRLPTIPLESASAVERRMWRDLWRKPQAAEWDRLGLKMQVAAYVRAYVASTVAGAPAALKTAVLRMEDGLGLSPMGLRSLRWLIADPVHKQSPRSRETEPVRRLRAVSPAPEAGETVDE